MNENDTSLETQKSGPEIQPADAEVAADAREVAADGRVGDVSERGSIIADKLRFGAGIRADEHHSVIDSLGGLEGALAALDHDGLELEIWSRKRATTQPTTYLRVKGRGVDHVAQSSAESFEKAVIEVKDKMRRQLSDARSKRSNHRR